MTRAMSRLVGESAVTQRYAFCEPVTAAAMGKIHLRSTEGHPGSPAGLSAGTAALCGRDLRSGWDLELMATEESIAEAGRPRASDGHVWLCSLCAEQYAREEHGDVADV